MATYTSTVFANQQPKGVHVGRLSVGGQAVVPGTGTAPSAGDIVFLAKIPHGAVIEEIIVDHTCADTIAISYGLASGHTTGGNASLSALAAGVAKDTLTRRTAKGLPGGLTISCSDNDPNRYGIFSAKVESGSLTATATINFLVIFRNDGT
jgi:hypothetical protein